MRSQGALGFTEIRFVSTTVVLNLALAPSCHGSKKEHLNVRILTSTSVLMHTENITVVKIFLLAVLNLYGFFHSYSSMMRYSASFLHQPIDLMLGAM